MEWKYHWTGGLSLRPPHSHLSHSFIHLLLLSFIHPANNYWEDTLSRTLEQSSGDSSLPKCFSTGLPATNFMETDQRVMKSRGRGGNKEEWEGPPTGGQDGLASEDEDELRVQAVMELSVKAGESGGRVAWLLWTPLA